MFGEYSDLAQQNPTHVVLGVLAQHQGRPPQRRGDVLPQVHQVHALPDLVGRRDGDVVGDGGVALEVGARLPECRALEREETIEETRSAFYGWRLAANVSPARRCFFQHYLF